jgi:hypothetical protein
MFSALGPSHCLGTMNRKSLALAIASTALPPIDTSPPRAMRDRLAVLATLLI